MSGLLNRQAKMFLLCVAIGLVLGAYVILAWLRVFDVTVDG